MINTRRLASKIKRVTVTVTSLLASVFAHFFFLTRAGIWSSSVLKATTDIVYRQYDDGHDYLFSAKDPLLLWRAQSLFTKEPETLNWIRTFKSNDIFYDIGANVGTYTVYAAPRCSHVYAFEPESSNYAALNQNIRLNGIDNKVRAYPIAIAEKKKLDSLRLQSTNPGAALHVFGRNTDFKHDQFSPAFEQGALALTLDEIVFELNLPPPTQIKIDVDGLESEILRGATKLLSHKDLCGLLLEINELQPSDTAMIEYLASFGFQIKHKGEPVIDTTGKARMVNYIFFRE